MASSTSIESARSSAYSEDLRWRIIWQQKALGYSCQEVAKNLCIDKSTVSRISHRFLLTGMVSKRKYPKEKAQRKITTPVQIFQLVLRRTGIFLEEIQKELQDVSEY